MHHARVLRPADGIYAFYDGRIDGYRYDDGPNWVDGGALSLGIASYASSTATRRSSTTPTSRSSTRASSARCSSARGADRITVVLSHWHLDHIAGTVVFDDVEVIANRRTAELLERHREAIEAGTASGPAGDRSARPSDADVRGPSSRYPSAGSRSS